MPRVSAIIATYNRAATIVQAVESVLAQTYPDLELIVVDDGSDDGTGEALAPFGDRITYHYQENRERGAARNQGLRLATGEFAALLDSDDLWLPDKIEREMTRMQSQPELGLVYSDARYVDPQLRPLGRVERAPREGRVLRDLVRANFVTFSAHLLRRAPFLEMGGFCEDRRLSGSEDWEAWVRFSARVPFGYAPHVGTLYRQHPGATVADPRAMERSMLYAHERVFANPELMGEIADLRAPARARTHQVLASLYYAAEQLPAARRHLLRAARAHPPVLRTARYLRLAARLIGPGGTLLRRLKHRRVQGISTP